MNASIISRTPFWLFCYTIILYLLICLTFSIHFLFVYLLKTQKLIIFLFFFISRSDTSHSHLRSRHPPLGDDGHMDDGGGDDDLQALLPASRGLSREDLSQVINILM